MSKTVAIRLNEEDQVRLFKVLEYLDMCSRGQGFRPARAAHALRFGLIQAAKYVDEKTAEGE
jgi:hypothetical protein